MEPPRSVGGPSDSTPRRRHEQTLLKSAEEEATGVMLTRLRVDCKIASTWACACSEIERRSAAAPEGPCMPGRFVWPP
eukprot:364409-Chlamydomonas_euryale.AAC.18